MGKTRQPSKAPAVIDIGMDDEEFHEPPSRAVVRALVAAIGGKAQVGTCRVCGCTDADCRGCIRRTHQPCWWVDAEQTLCSACLKALQQRTPLEARLIGLVKRLRADIDEAAFHARDAVRVRKDREDAKKLLAALGVTL